MRLRSTTIGLATLGLILSGTVVLGGTAFAATCSPEGATRPSIKTASTIETCTNGVWVAKKCPALRPKVTYYPGPPPYYMCTPVGAY